MINNSTALVLFLAVVIILLIVNLQAYTTIQETLSAHTKALSAQAKSHIAINKTLQLFLTRPEYFEPYTVPIDSLLPLKPNGGQ